LILDGISMSDGSYDSVLLLTRKLLEIFLSSPWLG